MAWRSSLLVLTFAAAIPGPARAENGVGGTQIDRQVNAIADRDFELYVGGNFGTASGVPASNIARWDSACWSALGDPINGVDGKVHAIAPGPGGRIYAGGEFRTAGGATANNIAVWDGARWSALDTGTNGVVRALAITDTGELYAGGEFTQAGSVAVNNLARWDGRAWNNAGGGLRCRDGACRASVRALVWYDGRLYIGGAFTDLGSGGGTAHIAVFDGVIWSIPVFDTPNGRPVIGVNDTINALAIDSSGRLYLGGAFTRGGDCTRTQGNPPVCDTEMPHIARYDGVNFTPLGRGTNGDVYTLAARDPFVYAGGDFAFAFQNDGTSLAANSIASWSDLGWAALGSGIDGYVTSIRATPTRVYAGGAFETIGALQAGHVAFFEGMSWAGLGCAFEVPIEGGVRARAEIPPALASPLPAVRVGGVAATNVSVSADGTRVYFKPPPRAIAEQVDVEINNGATSLTLPAAIAYTADIVRGVEAVERGLALRFDELLTETPADFARLAPLDGAVAEVILAGIFHRAAPPVAFDRPTLSTLVEHMGPNLRDLINRRRPANADFAAIFRPLTYGQTVHDVFRPDPQEKVLFTLAPGSLTLKPGRELVEIIELNGGSIWLPGEFSTARRLTTTYYGFDLVFRERAGVVLEELLAFPIQGDAEYISPRIATDRLVAFETGGNESDRFQFREADLSHIYLRGSDQRIELGADAPWLTGYLVGAVYRQNLDFSQSEHNIAEPAIVARQSYVLVQPYADFEPAHCLLDAHIFPRVSFSLSQPDGSTTLPYDRLRVDYRLELEPQRKAGPDAYVAGFFKDLDFVAWWFNPEPCQFPECMPLPFWWNIFDPLGTKAPITHEMLVSSDEVDNLHLHHVHDDTLLPPWSGPVVEAPGSFNGSIHLHWRWGAGFGDEFGGGQDLFPPGQKWYVAVTADTFQDGAADFKEKVESLVAAGLQSEISVAEKSVFLGCEQSQLQPHIQYETFSTGFSYALGVPPAGRPDLWPPGHPCPGRYLCPIADLSARLGGYYANTIGFGSEPARTAQEIAPALGPVIRALFGRGVAKAFCIFGRHREFPEGPIESCADGFFGSELTPEAESSCARVELIAADRGKQTPFTVPAGAFDISVATSTSPDAAFVADNVFALTSGFSLTEPAGRPGSTIALTFDPPVRAIRWLPIAVRQNEGTARATIKAFRGARELSRISVEASVFAEARRFAEAFADIDAGEAIDRLEITSDDPNKELAISGFEVCDSVIERGDIDRDGDLDDADLDVAIRCFAGPGVIQGFECRDADLDGDRDVDCDDLAQLSNRAGISACDADGDRRLDVCDDAAPPPPPPPGDDDCDCRSTSSATSEGSSSILLGLFAMMVCFRARRRAGRRT